MKTRPVIRATARALIGSLINHGADASNPLSQFPYFIDFAAGTAKGGTQPYGSNSNDGRLLRDGVNSVASFCPPNADGTVGTLASVASSGLRRTAAGIWQYPSLTNRMLWNRDLTNAVWVISNGTDLTAAKSVTGADGAANAATRLTCNVANGTIKQSITLASGQVVLSWLIKRANGTGPIRFTVDDGASWTAIESGLNGNFQPKFITQAAVLNPKFGIQMGTVGDQVSVDFGELITPANSMNIPKRERVTVSGLTVLNTQCRPTADSTDIAPQSLLLTGREPFAFYWRGRSERGNGSGIITGSTNNFCSIIANNAVTFAVGGGTAQTANNAFNVGLASSNIICGVAMGDGTIRVACNGVYGESTGATFDAAMDHWDFGTNGNGSRSIYGVTEALGLGPISANAALAFSQADLTAMSLGVYG